MEKLRVGYLSESYTYERNIINIVENIEYKKVLDIYKLFFSLVHNLPGGKLAYRFDTTRNFIIDSQYKFNDLNLNKGNIFHFFNTVSYGKTPWISTFETVIPKVSNTFTCHWGQEPDFSSAKGDRSAENALRALVSPSCKKLITLSESSLKIQKDFLQHFPSYKDDIESKLCVLHPPQTLLIKAEQPKVLGDGEKLKFMFVGRAFFRKGGMETLRAFTRLQKLHAFPIELIIVSSLDMDSYATHETLEDVKEAKKIIGKNLNWIRYYAKLSNQKVLEMMRTVHIGLLPTWADTYGYSVLEFQASGCPVISTDIRALPEINNNDIGWLINIPKNRLGEAIYTSPEQRHLIRESIEKELEKIVVSILGNNENLIGKSLKAIAHIKQNHSLVNYAQQLQKIYTDAQ